MPKAWVLKETVRELQTPERELRLAGLSLALRKCGFEPIIPDAELRDEDQIERIATQTNHKFPERVCAADKLIGILEQAREGDVILATEPWHELVFRGIPAVTGGYWNSGIPMVEMWIDYTLQRPFAYFCVFATEFHRAYHLGKAGDCAWQTDWTVVQPHFPGVPAANDLRIHVADETDMTTRHILYSLQGIPIAAPYWGPYPETVSHGKTGMLYKSSKAREVAIEWAKSLDSGMVREAAGEKFKLDTTVEQLKPYLMRLTNHG